jgi:protoporphyrinogen oxidase
MRVGVVGGGVLGLALAYFLSREGVETIVFEGKDKPGGLLDYFNVDGAWIDKYYHCILSNDAEMLALVDELGLRDRVRFTATRQGVYRHGRLYSMASGKDFLLFPPLSAVERIRLGLTILGALRVGDHRQLEDVSVEDWLVKLGGRGTFEKLWQPMLKAKFDDNYHLTPATYIWSRLKRTTSTRAAAGQQERMGYFVGSYKVFVDRLAQRIRASGSAILLGARVREVLVAEGRVTGVRVDEDRVPLDAVVATTPLQILHNLLPEPQRTGLGLPPGPEFLGVVCGVLLLDRSLTPYYTLNIADPEIPFTGIIETTNLIAPEHVGGYHLAYLPKYVTAASSYVRLSDEELRGLYLHHLTRMFPGFSERWIKQMFVFRERFVEPLHQIGRPRPVVPIATSLPGLFILNNGQIYPELTNCQASVRHALGALPTILDRPAMQAEAAVIRVRPATGGV